MTKKELEFTQKRIGHSVQLRPEPIAGVNVIGLLLILTSIIEFVNKEFVKDGKLQEPGFLTKIWKGAKAIVFLFTIVSRIRAEV